MNNQLIYNFYKNRVQHFVNEENVCERQNNRYTWLRLALIVSAITCVAILYPFSTWLSIIVGVALFAGFGVVLKKHLTNIELQQQKERLKIINQQELNCLEGDFSAYSSGCQYSNTKHFYTSDLDIFGNHSLFRYLNRTTSPSGSDKLAEWLSKSAETSEIKARQEAVRELSDMVEMRQKMQAIGLKHKNIAKELPHFIKWLHNNTEISNNRIIQILPWLTLTVIIMTIVGYIPSGIVWLPLSVHFIMYGTLYKKVNSLHQMVSQKVEFVSVYTELIELVYTAKFYSPYLISIRDCFLKNNALKQIKALQNRIQKLDYRLNTAYIPINILFFFDYKHLVWLERWRTGEGQKLPEWFEELAKFEALSSFANLFYNNPTWTTPEIHDDYFHLEAKNIGHPLIVENRRMCNDFSLIGAGKIAVVTGSNMSGKSTFERSIGVNTVLALAGAPVCASRFIVTNCKLFTYMRIADNLEEQTSSFYAEIQRLKQLIDSVKDGENIFFLLDEVLRGTNSHDRQIGSMALIKQLAKLKTSGIIATHDLTLGELEHELPENISNSHFDVQIDNDKMSFDYKLHKGICKSLNASILMKKIGIEVD